MGIGPMKPDGEILNNFGSNKKHVTYEHKSLSTLVVRHERVYRLVVSSKLLGSNILKFHYIF
jgi:hypothetical protein